MSNSTLDWIDGHVPIDVLIPFDFGHNYHYAWISYITVLCLGVLLNVLALYFMYLNQKSTKSPITLYLSYLACQDLSASLVCLIQCSINLHQLMILGESTACIIEAWQVCFFVGISGFSVCLYGFYLRERTGTSHTRYVLNLQSSDLLKLHLVVWTIYAGLALMATYWPGQSRLLSSGTYCMPALQSPAAAIIFFGLIIAPCALFLLINYITIYINIKKVRNEVASATTVTDSTAKLVTQFLCFVIVYCAFYLPFLMAACYEWMTGFHASAYFDLVAGVLTHFVSVMNPIMYVLTTKRIRRAISKSVSGSNLTFSTMVQVNSSGRLGDSQQTPRPMTPRIL